MSASHTTSNPVRRHRRDIWLRIVAPVAIAALLLVAFCVIPVVAVASDELVSAQVSVVMGIVATAFIAPAGDPVRSTVCGSGRDGGGSRTALPARPPLQTMRRMTEKAAHQTDRFAPKVAQPSSVSTRESRDGNTQFAAGKERMQVMSDMAKKAEEQVSELIDVIEEQDAQVWLYLIGGVVALLIGLIAAYFYAQSIKERRKSRLERIKETLRGGISL